MALYTWLSSIPKPPLAESFAGAFEELGFKILEEASGEHQIYAEEIAISSHPHTSRVNVLVCWTCASKIQCQIEVRSSEAMLKRGTRCEEVATALKTFAPISN